MASVEQRLREMASENLDLGHAPDLDAKLSESDVSSQDAVAFIKLVNHESNVDIPPEDLAKPDTMRSLPEYIGAHS